MLAPSSVAIQRSALNITAKWRQYPPAACSCDEHRQGSLKKASLQIILYRKTPKNHIKRLNVRSIWVHKPSGATCAQIFRVPSTGSPASSPSAGLRCRFRIREGGEGISESSVPHARSQTRLLLLWRLTQRFSTGRSIQYNVGLKNPAETAVFLFVYFWKVKKRSAKSLEIDLDKKKKAILSCSCYSINLAHWYLFFLKKIQFSDMWICTHLPLLMMHQHSTVRRLDPSIPFFPRVIRQSFKDSKHNSLQWLSFFIYI